MADGWVRPYDWCDKGALPQPETLFRHPGDLAAWDRSNARKKVCIVGGGIAGLAAAFELVRLEHEVTVLEAEPTWGGRILTERFGNDDGPYAELGAMRIPYGHLCVDHYVDAFGLQRRHFVSENNRAWFSFRGERWRRGDWPTAASAFGADRHWGAVLTDLGGSIPRPPDAGMWGQVLGDWSNAALSGMEQTSLAQLVAYAIGSGTISEDEWTWVSHAKGFGWIDDASILFWDNVSSLLDPGGRYEIVGGMGRLTQAFVGKLQANARAQLVSSAVVTAVDVDDGSARVNWIAASGEEHQRAFDYAIVGVPPPCVARIRFSPALSARQMDALRAVYYFPIAKSVVLCKQRFWEANDGIYGGSSATDLPVQQLWYPSDNASPLSDDDADHLTAQVARQPGVPLSAAPVEPTDWKARDPRIAQGPGALIGGYMWGINALRFGALNHEERERMVVDCLDAVHPGASGQVDSVRFRVWGEGSRPGGGGFAYFRPTEQRRFASLLCRPHPDPGAGHPRVFFAGEHDGVAQGWIQGAIQSALAAAASVASQP